MLFTLWHCQFCSMFNTVPWGQESSSSVKPQIAADICPCALQRLSHLEKEASLPITSQALGTPTASAFIPFWISSDLPQMGSLTLIKTKSDQVLSNTFIGLHSFLICLLQLPGRESALFLDHQQSHVEPVSVTGENAHRLNPYHAVHY